MIEEAKKIVWIAFLIILLLGSFLIYRNIFKPKDDGFIEETIESFIESKTGLNIELTPKSPE